jgi:hypothetical protein
MISKTVNELVYGLFILDYQRRLEDIRLIEGEEYTESYTRFMEDIVQFCKKNDLVVDDVMTDIALNKIT